MPESSDDGTQASGQARYEVIESVLRGMSGAELRDLRTAAHRLKHLPFARLVNVLLTEGMDARLDDRDSSESKQVDHDFADASTDRCASPYTEDLLKRIDIEILSRSADGSEGA